MALPDNGPISMSQMATTYSTSNPISISMLKSWSGVPSNNVYTGPMSFSSFYGKMDDAAPILYNETGVAALFTMVNRRFLGTGSSYTLTTSRYSLRFTSNTSWAAVSLRNNATDSNAIDIAHYNMLQTAHASDVAKVLALMKQRGKSISFSIELSGFRSASFGGTLVRNSAVQLYVIGVNINGVDNELYFTNASHGRFTRTFNITSIVPTDISSFYIYMWVNVYDNAGFSSGAVTLYGITMQAT